MYKKCYKIIASVYNCLCDKRYATQKGLERNCWVHLYFKESTDRIPNGW